VAAPFTGEVLRVPVWSARAQENLERLPQHVAEAALGRIHDLSLGSPNAWRQAKRLQDLDGLMSTRVGIHYRVLFRMEGRRIEVEEVLSREAQARAIMRRR
jgi:mRNA-degrading endonuclease RelE of RelBE toxin-antitoxin system